ncbi:MAG: NADH-quinone oxidoreductase subunit B family protein [Anaerolineae bacterium]
MAETFGVLQLSGCAGCEVSLINAQDWIGQRKLAYMPLILSAEEFPPVDTLLVSGAVRTDDDLYRLLQASRRTKNLIAVGTCAISGGVANLGDRDDVRQVFFSAMERRHVPRLLPKLHPVDAVVPVTRYLPGCPPMPHLFITALFGPSVVKMPASVCIDCGRKKTRDRPSRLKGIQEGIPDPDMCLINQGYLCIGSSTRGGCRAPCTRAGNACVGCRGPSDGFISRSSHEWLTAIHKVFSRMTDIPEDEIDRALHSPHLSLFIFQFADYSVIPRPPEKVL